MPSPTRGPVTINELTAGLVWPRLLRAPTMALAPGRLSIGFVAVVIMSVVGSLFDRVRGTPVEATGTADGAGVYETLSGRIAELLGAVWVDPTSIHQPWAPGVFRLVREHPFSTLGLLLLLLPVWTLFGGAIARSVACDAAWRLNLPMRTALRQSRSRWFAMCAAFVAPLLVAGVAALLVAFLGLALLRTPYVNVVGGAAYPLFLALGLVVVFLGVFFALGQPLLAPAAMADGADGLDSVQRAYAYVLGRPGRYIVYSALLAGLGLIGFALLSIFVGAVVNWTASLSAAWTARPSYGGGVAPIVWERMISEPDIESGGAGATLWLVRFWEGLAVMLVWGWAFSYYFSAGTLLYLTLRRVNDDQDIEDIWSPVETPPAGAGA